MFKLGFFFIRLRIHCEFRILQTFPYQLSIAYSYITLGITRIPFSVDCTEKVTFWTQNGGFVRKSNERFGLKQYDLHWKSNVYSKWLDLYKKVTF